MATRNRWLIHGHLPGGGLSYGVKEEAQAIEKRLCESFARSRSLKPKASRKGTSERYLVGHGFR